MFKKIFIISILVMNLHATKKENSFELGFLTALSNKQDSLELLSDNSKIYYEYENIPMFGLSFIYKQQLSTHHFLGLKTILASSVQTYTDIEFSDLQTRNDGNPLIVRASAGPYYAYRFSYFSFGAGVNYNYEYIQRKYSNRTYEYEFKNFNAEATLAYFATDYLKLSFALTSDMFKSIGIAYIF